MEGFLPPRVTTQDTTDFGRSTRANSGPLTVLKLKRGTVKRNGKGSVIDARVFT